MTLVAVAVAAVAVLAGWLPPEPSTRQTALAGHAAATPAGRTPAPIGPVSDEVGRVTGRWAPPDFLLMAAARGHAFGIGAHGAVVRLGDDGVRRLRLTPPDAPDMPQKIVASADGTAIYAVSEVIKRFTDRPDRLWRIDPDRMTVTATVDLDQSPWELATTADALYVGTPTTVLRLDPTTLHRLAAYRVPGTQTPPRSSSAVFTLAANARQVYAGAGDAESARLWQISPALRPLGWTDLPRGQGTTLDGSGWLTTPDGTVHPLDDGVIGAALPVRPDTCVSADGDLLALTGSDDGHYTLVRVAGHGRVAGRQPLPSDVAGELAYDESTGMLWLGGAGGVERLVITGGVTASPAVHPSR